MFSWFILTLDTVADFSHERPKALELTLQNHMVLQRVYKLTIKNFISQHATLEFTKWLNPGN